MNQDRWQAIVGQIKDNFPVHEHGRERREEDGGTDIEFIVFDGPLGRMKLEFITKPVVLDKKTLYSRRIGSDTKVEYVYSEDEKTSRLAPYRWDEGLDDWAEIDIKNFRL